MRTGASYYEAAGNFASVYTAGGTARLLKFMRGLRSTVATSQDPVLVSSSATVLALIYAWGVDPSRKYVYHPNSDTDIPVVRS